MTISELLKKKDEEIRRLKEENDTLQKSRPQIKLVIKEAPMSIEDIKTILDTNNRLIHENDIYRDLSADRDELKKQLDSALETVHTCEQIVSEYEKENKELKEKEMYLRGKMISQDITINSYRDRYKKSVIAEGSEHDLYPGEQKDFILELLRSRFDSNAKNSRQYMIIKSLLEANHEDGTRADIKRRLSAVFKNFGGADRLNKQELNELKDLGFKVIIDGHTNHAKIMFMDDSRYTYTLPCTVASFHSGMNQYSDLAKMIF